VFQTEDIEKIKTSYVQQFFFRKSCRWKNTVQSEGPQTAWRRVLQAG